MQGSASKLDIDDSTVDLIVTSPPYFGLRSYQDGGKTYEGQIGREETREEYLDALVECTREWKRVLKDDGSIWVNLGDGYQNRSLTLVPHLYVARVAEELDLTVRGEIIWSKSGKGFLDARAKDRVRKTHEYWFHLTTGKCFSSGKTMRRPDNSDRPQRRRAEELFVKAGLTEDHRKAIRAVGIIDSQGGSVRSGGRWGSENGKLAEEARKVLGSYYREFCTSGSPLMPPSVLDVPVESFKVPEKLGLTSHFASFPTAWPHFFVSEWCRDEGVVLDPFGGTGTTALVASVLGRHGISNDLSADYNTVASWRTTDPKQRAKVAELSLLC